MGLRTRAVSGKQSETPMGKSSFATNLTDEDMQQIRAFLPYLQVQGFRLWLIAQKAKQMCHALTVDPNTLVNQLINDIISHTRQGDDGQQDLSRIGMAALSLEQLLELVDAYDKYSKVIPSHARPSEKALRNCLQDLHLLVAL
ncbi:MAG TPA: hypothetical protein VFO38_06650 [Candidatus Saccharimonadales bacterium]|nr:hypothetical protein [Candidatus Saccharimonadales bacterium]